jgi:hypothetical protein
MKKNYFLFHEAVGATCNDTALVFAGLVMDQCTSSLRGCVNASTRRKAAPYFSLNYIPGNPLGDLGRGAW